MKKIFSTTLFVMFSFGVLAQDLNQTVRISNDYKVGSSDAEKKSVGLSVPDSASRFDYNFDYSVFDAPYKGAYEFRPFLTSMTPFDSEDDSSSFWLKAGVGYALRPELKAIWEAVKREKFSWEFHQDFNGFVGNYRDVRTNMSEKRPLWTTSGLNTFGYDLSENFGTSCRIAIKTSSELRLFVDYQGLFNDDGSHRTSYNSGLFSGKYSLDKNKFDLEVNLSALLATDYVSHPFESVPVRENVFKLDGFVSPYRNEKFRIDVDYDLRYMARSRNYADNRATVILVPTVNFDFEWVKLRAGANVSIVEELYVCPDLRADFKLCGGVLNPYVSVSGTAKPNSYSSLKYDNHWFNPGYTDALCSSVENLNAHIGLRGSISRFFEYDVQGGYLNMSSDALWGVRNNAGKLNAALVYQDYNAGFIKAKLSWKSKSVEADGSFHFIKTDILDRVSPSSALVPFDLPVFSGDFRVVYNYRKRIYAGATLEFATDRNTVLADVESYRIAAPSYFNLGIFGEYKFNDKLSFWLKGENLLNAAIQRVPLHVESGIGATLGITLIL